MTRRRKGDREPKVPVNWESDNSFDGVYDLAQKGSELWVRGSVAQAEHIIPPEDRLRLTGGDMIDFLVWIST